MSPAGVRRVVVVVALASCLSAGGGSYSPRPGEGYPAGLIPDCPGVMKNASISPGMMSQLQLSIHTVSRGSLRRRTLPIQGAAKALAQDRDIDDGTSSVPRPAAINHPLKYQERTNDESRDAISGLRIYDRTRLSEEEDCESLIDLVNKKTVVYCVGFLDSSVWPHSQAVGNTYARRGYNAILTNTLSFLSYIYPKSVRLSRTIGWIVGDFLVKLYELGLDPDKLELVGTSLGAHVAGHAAKRFYKLTGKKPARITGLDPAGPCYRNLPPDQKLSSTDGQQVDIVHTNIDGFGIAERLGHVDFYVNGGEFQPSDIPYIPCLVVCSHLRAVIYWWQALEHPKKFIAMQCDSVQDARFANCFNNSETTNYLGIETNFAKQGVFYLPTFNEFPYYRAKEGLKEDNEIYTSTIRKINSDNGFTV